MSTSISLTRRALAEAVGTFWLVLCGCGAAVLAAKVPQTGIGQQGVALAFGLSLLTMAYAIGSVSGCHVNPAVSVGLAVGGRFPAREVPAYVAAQVVGGALAGLVLFLIARTGEGFSLAHGFATNGYGAHSPGGYALASGFLAEVVTTAFFLFVIMSLTREGAPGGAAVAPVGIGLCLTLIHLVTIPVTNTSVNPARSTAVALVQGGWAMGQLWMFWLAPLLGGALGAASHRALTSGQLPALPPSVKARSPRPAHG